MTMKIASSLGISMSPNIYKGRGLYQIHLVKADAIRPFIPQQLKLVQTFGRYRMTWLAGLAIYTLGGFYLGNYEDSFFGAFEELVVIAGIVKTGPSPPCAWSSMVLVSNDQVRDYAQKELGVESQVAKFSKKVNAVHERKGGFLNINGLGNCKINNYKQIDITEIQDHNGSATDSSSNFIIESAVALDADLDRLFVSPQIKLSFPSLSGLTEHIPDQLLQYTCQMETRVRVVAATKVSYELTSENEILKSRIEETKSAAYKRNCMSKIVVQSKPFIAFEFNSMKMMVDSPTLLYQRYTR